MKYKQGFSMNKIILSIFIILVSLIYGLPHIILFAKLGNDYQPLVINKESPIARDETYAYAPQVKHILEGNISVGEVYVREYQNLPTPFFGETLPSWLMAVLASITGSIPSAFIVADFIFPPIIFLLLLAIARIFIKNFFFAASIAFLTVIARDFITVIPYPHSIYQYLTVAEHRNQFLYFSRAFHPQVTFVVFAVAFITLFNLLKSPESIKMRFIHGVTFGLLFYSYVFYWTYFIVFFATVVVLNFLKRDVICIKALSGSAVIAFFISIPYFVNMYNFYQLDIASDFVAKSSLAYLDLPPTLFRYLIIILAFWMITRLKGEKFFFLTIFLISGLAIPVISKIVIGKDLETFHYLRRAMMPFATIALFVIVYLLISKSKFVINLTATVILLLAVWIGFKTQIVAANTVAKYHILDEDLKAVFAWLNQNTEKNSTVGSMDTFFNRYLPVYTHNKVYFPSTDRTVMTTTEGVKRYSVLANLLGINVVWQKQNLDNTLSYMFIYQAYTEGVGLDFNSPKRYEAERLIDQVSANNWQNLVNVYNLDYIVMMPPELSLVFPDSKYFVPVTSISEYVIFKVIRP